MRAFSEIKYIIVERSRQTDFICLSAEIKLPGLLLSWCVPYNCARSVQWKLRLEEFLLLESGGKEMKAKPFYIRLELIYLIPNLSS